MIALAQIDCVDSTLEQKKIVAEIAASANKIGMATLARVAFDVYIVMACQDMASIGATLVRLRRVGGRSVYAIYDSDCV